VVRAYQEAAATVIQRFEGYIVVTSFFPLSLIGTCEVERLIVFCGSRPPFQ